MVVSFLAGACAPAASTTAPDFSGTPHSAVRSIEDLAARLASADHRPARIRTYLAPLRHLERRCAGRSFTAVSDAVQFLADALRNARLDVPPDASAEAVLAADASRGADCMRLAEAIDVEVTKPVPTTNAGWGGYAGTAAAWRLAHHGNRAFQSLSGAGRVLTAIRRFTPPVTADLALASIERSLLPGKVHVVYGLRAAQCQQAIYMGEALGSFMGNPDLGAFVELSSGKGVGRTPYDSGRVDRARITPLGRIGGQPCN